ncbi:transcriptional regulator GlxA family with amidase domain [Litorivivens lipolytica]|uniref:Transcriptional regulator GlxA family with amidase domain n=1 Tax=Litorivivens lipolytica TaxID=1524264 RepID=A0A7W4W4F4_9GAMM|nr:AraC family transcriptional regulator [Litorivivens lipolytica]MBB3046679.1 transcriptional regulator GlxA family with amidase domain [Litorivivens lipolytica]
MVNIALLALPNALTSSLSLPLEMLQATSDQLRMARQKAPQVQLLGFDREPVKAAGGLSLSPEASLDEAGNLDLIILPTRWRHPLKGIDLKPLSGWLNEQYRSGSTLCTVGTGSYLLAESGLLNKRPATTHWHYFEDFAERYPEVDLIRNYLITETERIYCAGSINSIADLLVHIIGERWGTTIAHRVERQFSPEIRRPFHSHAYRVGQTDLHRDEAIALVQSYISKHFSGPIQLSQLAEQAGLSERSLTRRFKQATGQSPLDYLNTIRLRTARELLQQSNLAISDIAQTSGILDPNYFSRLFRREYGVTPKQYRTNVRGKLFSPGTGPKG